MPKKQYGLIIKNKVSKPTLQKSKLSFFNDDDIDEESSKAAIESELQKVAVKKKVNKQTQLDIQRALEQDATVFDYDELYDDMKAEKEEATATKKDAKSRKPKYMNSVMKTFEKRELLRGRREERKAHKERAEEKDEFADKEQFITNAYREKLKEMKEAEAEEARMDKIEEIMDVTKQKDMTGFFKHFLNRQVSGRNIRKKKDEESEEENTDDDEPLTDQVKRETTPPPPEPKEEHVENVQEQTTVKEEVSQDADSDFLSDDDEKPKDVKADPDVKPDPDKVKMEPAPLRRKSETLKEFKERLKKKKERKLDVYLARHTPDTLTEYRERYLERREMKRKEGLYV